LVDRITSSIPVDEEIILAASQQLLVSTLLPSESSLTDSAAERISNIMPVDEEIIDFLI
jgi:hypothetical protein